MSSNEVSSFLRPDIRSVLDVLEYCRRTGVDETEEKRLISLLGRYASCHELQINIVRLPYRGR